MTPKDDFYNLFKELSKEMEYTYNHSFKDLIDSEEFGKDFKEDHGFDFEDTFKELFADVGKMAQEAREAEPKAPSSRLEVETIMMRGFNLYPKAELHVDITKTGINLMHNWTILREWDHQRCGVICLLFEDAEAMHLTRDDKELMVEYFRSYRAK